MTYNSSLRTLAELTPFALLPIGFFIFYSFNRLVAIERTRFRDAWFNDGRPRRWFGSKATGEFHAMVECTFKWLFVTPLWARHDRESRHWITAFRAATLVWNVGLLAS